MIESLIKYLSYPFVQNALLVGILVSLAASLFGVPLVLKRFSFISDGLSHVAFGAVALASVFSLESSLIIVLPLTCLSAIILLNAGKSKKTAGDAAIAMFSVSALSIGYLIMNIFSTASNMAGDVVSVLFGSTSILTLNMNDVILTLIMSLAVLLIYILSYNRLFAISFDPDFSKASGVNADLFNFILALVTALIIVIGMRLVGSLLLSALIVFPALAGMRLFRSFRAVSIFAAIFASFSALLGIILSILFELPVGPGIVAFELVLYFICCLLGEK